MFVSSAEDEPFAGIYGSGVINPLEAFVELVRGLIRKATSTGFCRKEFLDRCKWLTYIAKSS